MYVTIILFTKMSEKNDRMMKSDINNKIVFRADKKLCRAILRKGKILLNGSYNH